jgi:oxepin-CoA hydrolase / 3-oxo-5,6-dehydrosuberyl-CoA semialdehyde dehydrogenase
VTLEDIEHFAEFTGDTFYAHMDEAAAANPFFPGRVAHGYLLLSFAAGPLRRAGAGAGAGQYGARKPALHEARAPGARIAPG